MRQWHDVVDRLRRELRFLEVFWGCTKAHRLTLSASRLRCGERGTRIGELAVDVRVEDRETSCQDVSGEVVRIFEDAVEPNVMRHKFFTLSLLIMEEGGVVEGVCELLSTEGPTQAWCGREGRKTLEGYGTSETGQEVAKKKM